MTKSATSRIRTTRCSLAHAQDREQLLSSRVARTLREMHRGCSSLDGHALSLGHLQEQSFLDRVSRMGSPPPDMTPQSAYLEVCGRDDYTREPSPSVPLDPTILSLRPAGSRPVSLEALLGPHGETEIDAWIQSHLLSNEVACQAVEDSPVKVYHDPLLRKSSRSYSKLLRRMHSAGMLDFGSEAPTSEVGLFAVAKKSGAQRMVVDCRQSNLHFRPADHVDLPTSSSIGSLRLAPEEQIYVGQYDLKDCFYQIGLPEKLRPYFGLPCLDAKRWPEMYEHSVDGRLFPRLAVLPMGWSHALFWCEHMHLRLLSGVLAERSFLKDGRPPDSLSSGVVSVYVDNVGVYANSPERCQELTRLCIEAVQNAGLEAHEVEMSSKGGELLGLNISSDGLVSPKAVRRWRVWMAIEEVLSRKRVSGKTISKILGHFTHQALLRRETLSAFRAIYVFAQKNFERCVPLWDSVRRELVWAQSLLPIIETDLKRPWSNTAFMTDASPWGVGIMKAAVDPRSLEQVGAWSEKWRFANPGGENARAQHGFDVDENRSDNIYNELVWIPGCAFDPSLQMSGGDRRHFFSDVPPLPGLPGAPFGQKWKVVSSRPWRRKEHISCLEARAMSSTLKGLLQAGDCQGHRVLIINDSMAATLASSKGRSSGRGMCRAIRQIASLSLILDVAIVFRWLPSELNLADAPSRRGLKKNVGTKVPHQGPVRGEQACQRPFEKEGRSDSAGLRRGEPFGQQLPRQEERVRGRARRLSREGREQFDLLRPSPQREGRQAQTRLRRGRGTSRSDQARDIPSQSPNAARVLEFARRPDEVHHGGGSRGRDLGSAYRSTGVVVTDGSTPQRPLGQPDRGVPQRGVLRGGGTADLGAA